jgi:hypothetical protein
MMPRFSASMIPINETMRGIIFGFDGVAYRTLGVERLEVDNVGVLRLTVMAVSDPDEWERVTGNEEKASTTGGRDG